jgi:hypothetical protein
MPWILLVARIVSPRRCTGCVENQKTRRAGDPEYCDSKMTIAIIQMLNLALRFFLISCVGHGCFAAVRAKNKLNEIKLTVFSCGLFSQPCESVGGIEKLMAGSLNLRLHAGGA